MALSVSLPLELVPQPLMGVMMDSLLMEREQEHVRTMEIGLEMHQLANVRVSLFDVYF